MKHILNGAAATFFLAISIVRLEQILAGSWMALFLCLQSTSASALLFGHRDAFQESAWWQRGLAWFAALLPMTAHPRTGQTIFFMDLVAAVGLLISVWTMWMLGESFGVAPADRGLVVRGPFRFVRHPMYLGALLAITGALFGHWTLWNAVVLTVTVFMIVLRIHWEEAAIAGYEGFRRQVRWRLLPFVW